MNVHIFILFLATSIVAGGKARAADDIALPGLGELGMTSGAFSLTADTRSLKPQQALPTPLEKVLQTIRQSLPGRALDARLVDRSGRQAYEIRWMGDNGKVSDITADAMSGEIVDRR